LRLDFDVVPIDSIASIASLVRQTGAVVAR
jgi:hypothetical protein